MEDNRATRLGDRANIAVSDFLETMRSIAKEARELDKDEQQLEIERLGRRLAGMKARVRRLANRNARLLRRLRELDPEGADAHEKKLEGVSNEQG